MIPSIHPQRSDRIKILTPPLISSEFIKELTDLKIFPLYIPLLDTLLVPPRGRYYGIIRNLDLKTTKFKISSNISINTNYILLSFFKLYLKKWETLNYRDTSNKFES